MVPAAPVGTPVRAVADGTIVSVGWNGGFGKQVRPLAKGDWGIWKFIFQEDYQRLRYFKTCSFLGGREMGFWETRMAMSGSLRPCPVRVKTNTSPFLKKPLR
jgi:hypothetical protein